jgi:hypothetical protein
MLYRVGVQSDLLKDPPLRVLSSAERYRADAYEPVTYVSHDLEDGAWQFLGDSMSGGTGAGPFMRIDTVVVYKVDRLTRSLADFAKIVEQFDQQGISFVSVTQQFNTTTSMGRLTLNVLLSFAQFEREVTGERIRDKIAASKRKGMWMGGVVPLGYELRDRQLSIQPEEAYWPGSSVMAKAIASHPRMQTSEASDTGTIARGLYLRRMAGRLRDPYDYRHRRSRRWSSQSSTGCSSRHNSYWSF